MTTDWPAQDGTLIACREKLRVLEENKNELESVLKDAFEDAVLMGVDADAMRRIFGRMVEQLQSPHR